MEALDRLSADEKQILLNFQAISGTDDLGAAVATLESHNWDLEAAVHSFFGDHRDEQGTTAGAAAQGDEPDEVPLLPTASSVASAPDEPQRLRADVQRPTPTLLALFTTPLQWGFKFLWAVMSFTLGFLPFLGLGTRRRTADFVEQYGDKHPAFYAGTYMQALDAAKREIRYLLVVLHSDEHDDTPAFCRETLASEAFINFVNERNVLVWGGNIKEAEAFKGDSVLGATAYPFMALITLQGSNMVVASRFEGLMSTERIITKLQRLFDRFDPQLAGARAERASREAARQIRQQQDAAYEASLRADQEKARKAREEMERLAREQEESERAEREKEQRRERRKQRKLELAAEMPAEPPASEPNTARLGIRLPSGQRVVRRFKADDRVQLLWNFVETHDLSPLDLDTEFVIVNPYPRRVYRDMEQTFAEAGLAPSASVVVEERIDDEL
ncbi:UBX domain-containing protein 10 [Polyrhizophydium stewartii]|uniref:UBX domain-containing protein 10 n=1 Tax=Polyrhizophydium stewartii TaxID=2732419 RepID=A0ABR4N1L6_9FUNG